MTALRARIFRRVKPKSLNGRNLTGTTLLELCYAYTEAINRGAVPCIESAWTSVCKSECKRAVQQALTGYRLALSN